MKFFPFLFAFALFFTFIHDAKAQSNVFTSAQQLQAASSAPYQDNTTGISLGMKFQSSVNGQVTGIRFYKAVNNVGTHVGQLWTNTGSLLGSVTFTNETASGWQQATLSTPISITAGQIYVVSYHSSQGFYSTSQSFFNTTSSNGPLTAIANTLSLNGLYLYTTSPAFPVNSYAASNYWVDIVFTSGTGDVTSPSVTATTPTSGATGVSTTTSIAVQVSEALQPSSVTTATAYIMNGSTAVPSTVSYTAGSQNFTLTPASALLAGTAYTVILKGGTGTNRILDLAGNPLSADYTWTFTTQSSGGGSTGWTLNGANLVNSNTGFVSIGTSANPAPTDPQLKLAVNGNIYAKKLKITQQGWADYVFEPTYKLMPLSELEAYINKNKHLPEVPSAVEVETKGLDLGDNQTILLKKIEELTLYVIELKKEIETMKADKTIQSKKK